MLFNSYEFIFLFLPLAAVGFFLFAKVSRGLAGTWLVFASLLFYGWWDPRYIPLLLGSIIFNYLVGQRIARAGSQLFRRALLTLGVIGNLALLGVFKYTDLFIGTYNSLTGTDIQLVKIVLPLGISFFTFTQIAFLVDVFQRQVREYNPMHYALFVTYFPHLIAGPILHHKQMMPQFASGRTYRPKWENVAAGLGIFIIGLSKKVLLADNLSSHVQLVFDGARDGVQPLFLTAWSAVLAYCLQLYFDFSGYSDMAIGISLLFGIRLPVNFNSPYRAANIIDFWRRWHITLSEFLKNYLYIPMGGNRRGKVRRYVNLMATMLLGGLWHGANWTFVVWGGLHGVFLVINHMWQALKERVYWRVAMPSCLGRVAGVLVTFLAVTVAWVFFRSGSFAAALLILKGMTTGVSLNGQVTRRVAWLLGIGFLIVWFSPSTQQLFARFKPAIASESTSSVPAPWLRLGVWTGAMAAGLLLLCVMSLGGHSEFLYFQF